MPTIRRHSGTAAKRDGSTTIRRHGGTTIRSLVGDSSRRCEEIVKKPRIAPLNAIIIIIIITMAERLNIFEAPHLANVEMEVKKTII